VIEKDILISEDQNGFGNRIHAQCRCARASS
jgi:hypothetical protein